MKTHQRISSSNSFLTVALALALAGSSLGRAEASVIVDGISYSAIQNTTGTGQIGLTGGSTLAVYGTAGTSGNDTQSVYTQFAQRELEVGESIRITFSLTDINFVQAAAGFRLSISSMPVSAGDQNTPNANWASGTRQGYNLWVPTVTSNSSSYLEFSGLQNPLSGDGSQNVKIGAATSTFLVNGAQNTFVVFQVTRDSLTSIQLSGSIGSTQLATVVDTTTPYFSFNTLQFGTRSYNDGYGFTIDNLAITVVPEPSVTLLLGVGLALALFGIRRHRRSIRP